jgi:phospholipid/cholesterol/gamma-HCH transport system substrate-binding protein
MESDARYAWVGAALLVLIAVLAGGLYWLNNSDSGYETQRYVIYFREQSLEGLQINSDVRMQGIKVGKVIDYIILPSQAKTVRVLIEVDARTPVLEGVEAVVTRNLVTGLAAVDLENVWKGGAPLTEVHEGEDYVVIEEGVPQITRFTRSLEELGIASQEAVGRFNTLLSDANQREVAGMLRELAALSTELRALPPELVGTLSAARRAAESVEAVGAELVPLARAGSTLARRAGDDLERLRAESEATLRATRATLQALDSELRDTSLRLRLTADLGLLELQTTARALRTAGETVQLSSRALAEPNRALFGPHIDELGPGER